MPTLHWVGKDKVKHHHRDVPYRVLNTDYGYQAPADAPTNSLDNRIIRGDNLEALKSLLPEFEGKVKCIYIDPPYNTGNEEWRYNDSVNDPRIKKWLGQVVGKEGEDMSRHDKWLCMMYPRLKLLHRLLADDGVVFVSIDNNEMAYLKILMSEIFGAENWVGEISWKNVTDNNPTNIGMEHEYVLCYAKRKSAIASVWKSALLDAKTLLLNLEQDLLVRHTNVEGLKREYDNWFRENKKFLGPLDRYKYIDTGGIYTGSQSVHNPGKDGYRYDVLHPVTNLPCKQPLMGYRFPWGTMEELLREGKVLFGQDESKLIELKLYVSEYKSKLASVVELDGRVGTNELKLIFPENKRPFDYPKPSVFVENLLGFATNENDLILDSFAGSASTAHAVLKLNAQDGGNRRFILIEMMDYVETLTAERVRRVMSGYGEGSKAVAGLGGGFSFQSLGEPLFDEFQYLNPAVGLAAIRDYVAYQEGIPVEACTPPESARHPYWLGEANGQRVFFCYEPARVTALDLDLLAELVQSPGPTLIYADQLALGEDFMRRHKLRFKKIPRDITRL
jgi:adenine-specific DNA-methyltransferase